MISENLQPVRTIGFFCTVIVLKIFNLSHLLLDLAPCVAQENAFFDAEITEIHEKKVFFARLEFESYL